MKISTIKNILLSIISTISFLGLLVGVELFLRHLNPNFIEQTANNDVAYLHRYDEIYGWAPKKNYKYKVEKAIASINSQGYRGKVYFYNKNSTKKRIIMLGDSIAFGYGVKGEQTFSDYLNLIDKDWEVINLSVQGYGTDQELIKLQNEGLRYQPDVVFLNFCLNNDFRDNVSSKFIYDSTFPKPFFLLEDKKLVKHNEHLERNYFQKFAFYVAQTSILFNKIASAVKLRKIVKHRIIKTIPINDNKEITFALIERMHNILKERGIQFIVLIFPDKSNFKPNAQPISDFYKSQRLKNVQIINMYDEYIKYGFNEKSFDKYSLDKILHLNPLGHQVTAKIIANLLISTPNIPTNSENF